MQRKRIPYLLTFLAGVVVSAIAMVFASASGNVASAARYDDLGLFTSVMRLVQQNYVEEVDESALIRGALRGMLSELDPHSSFLDTEAYREMQVDTRGEFHGLGIEITKRKDGFIEVVAPIEGTPAFQAGVRAKDSIVSICPTEMPKEWSEPCRSTKNMTLFEAVQLMRGKRGSEIKIDIFREGFEAPKQFTIRRDVVKIQSVTGRIVEPGYAYVRVRAFQEHTVDDLSDVLEDLRKQSKDAPIGGLVLDLRDDPGGLLDQAVKVANLWLSDGLVVYTKGRAEDQRQEFRATNDGNEPSYPIAVLVNEGTASASEIVAGALQDQRRALVIGEKTFGKGSVQTVYPLSDGAGLRLTTALYYTPAGRSIQEVGITPDIAVAGNAPAEGGSPSGRLRESDLEGHFRHPDTDGGTPGAAPELPVPSSDKIKEIDPGTPVADEGDGTDVQLARAVEVLKSWTYFEKLRGSEPQQQARAPQAEGEAPTPTE
jgi:carboxyl-terminal processing protease